MTIKEQCFYVCGPYKGYCGRAEYEGESDIFHGEIIGVRDVVTFQGSSPKALRMAFRDSVDDYLAFCKMRDEKPEKPFSGKFMTRIDPEVHRALSTMAEIAGKSLNQFIASCLSRVAKDAPIAPHNLDLDAELEELSRKIGKKKIESEASTTAAKRNRRATAHK